MQLSPEQKSAVAAWITEGASLSDVQKRLREEFNVSLTYMDTRFLVDDLGLDLKTPPKPKAPTPAAPPASGQGAATDANAELIDDGDAYPADPDGDGFADDEPPPAAPGGGKLQLEVDRVMRPGTVVSGTVTFSDGQTGKWALDQYGRLIFEPAVQGYRPSQADLQTFQRELSAQLQRQGY